MSDVAPTTAAYRRIRHERMLRNHAAERLIPLLDEGLIVDVREKSADFDKFGSLQDTLRDFDPETLHSKRHLVITTKWQTDGEMGLDADA